jgi:uncharacterized membrane protein (DUF485 family)
MKKLLISSAATLFTVAALAQGTVIFSNSALYKNSLGDLGSAASTWIAVPAVAGSINYGLFYGIGQSTSLTFLSSTLGVNSTLTPGVIASSADGTSSLNLVQIPGTSSLGGDANVWFQVKGWSASFGTDWAAAQVAAQTTHGDYFGQTAIVNAQPLGPQTGPPTPLWQSATGISPNKFAGGFAMFSFNGGAVTPEPSTMALAGLGMAAMLIFRRRK